MNISVGKHTGVETNSGLVRVQVRVQLNPASTRNSNRVKYTASETPHLKGDATLLFAVVFNVPVENSLSI